MTDVTPGFFAAWFAGAALAYAGRPRGASESNKQRAIKFGVCLIVWPLVFCAWTGLFLGKLVSR